MLSKKCSIIVAVLMVAGLLISACEPETEIVRETVVITEKETVVETVIETVVETVVETVKETVIVEGTPEVREQEVTKIVEVEVENLTVMPPVLGEKIRKIPGIQSTTSLITLPR